MPGDPSKVILVVLGVNGDNKDNRNNGKRNYNAAAAQAWHLLFSELERWTNRIVSDLRLTQGVMQGQRQTQQTMVAEAEWTVMAAVEGQHN